MVLGHLETSIWWKKNGNHENLQGFDPSNIEVQYTFQFSYRTSKKDFAYIRIMDEWKLFFSWSLIKTLLLASSVFYEWMEQYHGWMKTGKSSRKVTCMSLANLFGHGQSWAQKEIKTLTNIRFQSPNFLTCFKSEIKAKMTCSLTFWDL